MDKIKGGDKMLKFLKSLKPLKSLMFLSATVFIGIAESSVNIMCTHWMDEIELPEELKHNSLH